MTTVAASLLVLGAFWQTSAHKKYDDIRTAPYHPSIHNLGNVGLLGRVHAELAWVSTALIDEHAYSGRNMRRELAEQLSGRYPRGTTLLEVGCGVGTLTKELEDGGHFAITAIDTSPDMVRVARRHVVCPVACMNGVDVSAPVDLAVVSMVAHELPERAHRDLLRALLRTAKEVCFVDIDLSYTPSRLMLTGEPYIEEYLATWDRTLRDEAQGRHVKEWSLIPGHVTVWIVSERAKRDQAFSTDT